MKYPRQIFGCKDAPCRQDALPGRQKISVLVELQTLAEESPKIHVLNHILEQSVQSPQAPLTAVATLNVSCVKFSHICPDQR